jgi:hypothetical protein
MPKRAIDGAVRKLGRPLQVAPDDVSGDTEWPWQIRGSVAKAFGLPYDPPHSCARSVRHTAEMVEALAGGGAEW